jgi:acetyl-CoA carboxylase carboxyltransferase component
MSVIAFITPCSIVGNAVAGEAYVSITNDISVSAVNAAFIVKLYI